MDFTNVGVLIVGIIVGFLVATIYRITRKQKDRRQAVTTSRTVITGQITEQLAPLLPDFPYHYKDALFLGKGVDYIIFDGLHKGNLKQIVFLEIKTGTSYLNHNENLIKTCLEQKHVKYEIRRKKI